MGTVVSRVRRVADHPAPTPQPTPCRLWQGTLDKGGYGNYTAPDRRRWRITRWIWTQVNGPIPPGLVVRHRCDNRACFRLDHLEVGTVADNNRDAQARGHLGAAPKLPPSAVEAIARRKRLGETNASIHTAYPEVSLTTIKRIRP